MNDSWSREKPLGLLPAHANSVHWICMSVCFTRANWSPCLSLSVSHSLPTTPPSLSFSCFFLRHVHAWECKWALLVSFNTMTSPVFVSVCVCWAAFWEFKPTRVTHKCAWHHGPHEAVSGIRSLCCRFINTMQRAGINCSNYSSIEWGLLGPGLSTFLWGLFIPFVLYCAVMAAGTQQ